MSVQNLTLPEPLAAVLDSTIATVQTVWHRIPGSPILWRYIKSSHQNDPFRSILELLLFFFVIRTWRQSRTRDDATRKGYVKLSEKEIDELVSEWNPEPLISTRPSSQDASFSPPPIISGPASLRPKVFIPKTICSPDIELPSELQNLVTDTGSDGTETPGGSRGLATDCINLASPNFAGIAGAEAIKEKTIDCLKGYGVGSCGPPGFYGTFDLHMQLENDISRFLGTEGTVIYAQSFNTTASVIPTFSKRGDIIIADRGCNFAIQKGIQISRSTVRWYDHNDVASLERTLKSVQEEIKRYRKPLTRKFIITEGVFENDGMIVDLPKVLELANKFKYRLMLDETWSFGSMGRTGRGLTEVFDIPARDIDFIIGSMAVGLCSSGGFCAGSKEVVYHQRINSAALVFSAALPPLLAAAASEAITYLSSPQSTPETDADASDISLPLSSLSTNVEIIRSTLDSLTYNPSLLEIPSHPASPLIHVHVRRRTASTLAVPLLDTKGKKATPQAKSAVEKELAEEERLLQGVVDECLREGVLLTRSKKVTEQEMVRWRPSLRICVSAALSEEETRNASEVLRRAVVKVLGS